MIIPIEVKKAAVAGVALLAFIVAGGKFISALKTGAAQRLPDTPKYTRSEKPLMFWFLIVFFAALAILFAGLFILVLWRWHDEKVF